MATLIRRLALLVLLVMLCSSSLAAQVLGPWSGCRTDSLSNYNCAQYYSGTVTPDLGPQGRRHSPDEVHHGDRDLGPGDLPGEGQRGGEFEGPGMLVVEHKAAGTAGGGYAINVWCPESAGERPGRDDYPVIEIMDQEAGDYASLEGKDAHEHPDADSANGISGTETITWALKRT